MVQRGIRIGRSSRATVGAVVAAIGLVAAGGCGTGSGSSGSPESPGPATSGSALAQIPESHPTGEDLLDWVGPMASLAQITRSADVIAVGRFVGIKSSQEIFPDGAAKAAGGHSTGVMFTLLVFEVDEAIKGAPPKQLIVRQTGDLAKGQAPETFPAPKQGEQLLVFFTREPFGDDTWASINGPWGRMRVEGGVLNYQGGGERPIVEYMQASTLGEAVTQAKAEASRQGTRQPSCTSINVLALAQFELEGGFGGCPGARTTAPNAPQSGRPKVFEEPGGRGREA